MKTKDGVKVKVGDIVYVLGSTGVHKAKVLPPVTNYELFGPIEVKDSFSSFESAKQYRYGKQKE